MRVDHWEYRKKPRKPHADCVEQSEIQETPCGWISFNHITSKNAKGTKDVISTMLKPSLGKASRGEHHWNTEKNRKNHLSVVGTICLTSQPLTSITSMTILRTIYVWTRDIMT